MLSYLSISNYALIDKLEIDFRYGLNVLTGETGAGKTVLVGAIGLLLGDRADSIFVRDGAVEANFACQFDLS
ncbi:MAG: AAA family ATPase, partial [Actinomycetota bacterium]|nr:AAA family ATPase [Actinomycetota bacterium]